MALYTNEQLLEMIGKDLNKDKPSFLWLKELLDTFNTQIHELKKEVASLKLLIEHEEKIRVTKATKTRTKSVAPKFRMGDRVIYRNKVTVMEGTIIGIIRNRVQLSVVEQSPFWCDKQMLEHLKTGMRIS